MNKTTFQLEHGQAVATQFAAERHIMEENGGPGYGCSRRAARIMALLRALTGGENAALLTFRPEQPGSPLRCSGYEWPEHTVCANPEQGTDGQQLTIYDPLLPGPVPANSYAELLFPGQALTCEVRCL